MVLVDLFMSFAYEFLAKQQNWDHISTSKVSLLKKSSLNLTRVTIKYRRYKGTPKTHMAKYSTYTHRKIDVKTLSSVLVLYLYPCYQASQHKTCPIYQINIKLVWTAINIVDFVKSL